MKFSIIIPTFNRLNFLKDALQSIKDQTFKDFETIVINDNPDDRNRIILLKNHFNFELINHSKTFGGNAARNSGIKASRGEYLAFLDDDDNWKPNKLEIFYNFYENNPEASALFSGCIYWWDCLKSKDKLFYNSKINMKNFRILMSKGLFCPPTCSVVSLKRKCIDNCGLFDDELVSLQDWDFWYRISLKYDFHYIDQPLTYFRQHLGPRTSTKEFIRLKGIDQIKEKHKSSIILPDFELNLKHAFYSSQFRLQFLHWRELGALNKCLFFFKYATKKSILFIKLANIKIVKLYNSILKVNFIKL